ncbi:hypothetical protein [Alcanivorax sp. 1008]|uniref:hypothetical protein n=1 Tax=Alcanivorax sp. 1008 TaxID=2816853 RepID=UPI001D8BE225|nr:hypothetical protein [Alcanivorax sp. 1008]MCC1498084.1 hypothetical protein [Alcanivorax sp. 1008]
MKPCMSPHALSRARTRGVSEMHIDVIWRYGIEDPVSNGRLRIRLNGSAAEMACRDMAGCAGAAQLISQARAFYLVVEGEVIVTVARQSARDRQKYNNPGKSVRHWQARCKQGRAWGSA